MLQKAIRPGCIVSAILFSSVAGYSSAALAQTSELPNIIVVYVDDQGWNGTSVQMDPDIPESKSDFYQTPNLEALAASGMRFSNAYSSAPVCSPSRAALMTGKSSAQLQFTDIVGSTVGSSRFNSLYVGKPLTSPTSPLHLASEEISIAERLKEASSSYRTALAGKWHLSTGGIINAKVQGFDEWIGPGDTPADQDPKDIFDFTNASLQFMEDSVQAEQPFLTIISHFAVHWPWEARQELIDKYEALPPGERHSDPVFAAMTEDLDNSLGMVMDKVSELGITDNTYIIYTSDNGSIYALGEDENDPLYNHKGTVYEGGIRVPMVITGPGITPGSVCDVPVVGHDLFATISSLAGITTPLPDGVESGDLTPLLENGGVLPEGLDAISRGYAPDGELFFHYPHYINGGEGPRVPASAIRYGDYKLIRIYGENQQPDTLLLFNLAQTVEEDADPNSPLNLADDMPTLAAQLNARLEQWLQDTDASKPYDVATNIQLKWDAGDAGNIDNGWRSVIDVDQLQRETWTKMEDTAAPAVVDTGSAALPKAFVFDGNDGMTRRFFHVSDPVYPDLYDADHSASLEFWIRMDGLDNEQVLFESGDETSGLSLTVGDADSDGLYDDLRFRVLGTDGNYLSLTTPLTGAVDPTSEFIQLTAVFSDDPSDRYFEIYINGQLQARVDGVLGTDEIDWDGYDEAGLGMIAGTGLGANGGLGDLPFAGGGFRGELALFNYYNYAINASDIISSYIAIVGSIPGDLNGDGFVGIDDLDIVLSHWNQNVTPADLASGDANGDGYIGLDDIDVVLLNWNKGIPSGNASLPEPASLVLLGLGSMAALRRSVTVDVR